MRQKGKKNLSLGRLLNKQAKSLQKHPSYSLMMSHYHASERLKTLKINRRCYRLLDQCIISHENLPHLYKTYRLPKDPFFPLFLMIKKDYIRKRELQALKKDEYILTQVKKLPEQQRKDFRFLAEWEESLNKGGNRPLWDKYIYPKSMKKVDQIHNFSLTDWIEYYKFYIKALSLRYKVNALFCDQIQACIYLHIYPDLHPIRIPDSDTIQRAYRVLSRQYHPDSGGTSKLFNELQDSRELLLKTHSKT